MLLPIGFEVRSAVDGAQAVAQCKAWRPHLVLMDLHMPEMNGFDVQRALAGGHPAVPVVIVTGHDTPESHAQAIRRGAKAYLCKPVNDDALLAAIGTAIGGTTP